MSNLAVWNVVRMSVIAGALSIATSPSPASAANLFFFKGPGQAPNERICLMFARDEAKIHNLQNIKQDRIGITGIRDNFIAFMTCVGTVVVVTVAGDADQDPRPLAQELFDAIRHDICIDEC